MENRNKIMILGGGEGQMPLIQLAKGAGWYTIVVSPKGNYPGFALADECLYADISDKEAILAMAKVHEISAIATDQTDISVPTVLYVAEQLGLPHIECSDVDNFRYKSRMREVCSAAGLPTIASCVTDDIEEAKSFFRSLPTPKAIIKPVDSQGSRGVTKVDSIDALQTAFAMAMNYSKRKEIIIEQFVEGQEIEVDTVVRDGEIKAVLIGDVFNFQSVNTFSAYERIYPTNLNDVTQQYINEINSRTLKALGIRTGWTHGEYIVSNEGEVYLIEVGARGGGNYIGSDIVNVMLGYGTHEMAFMTAIGDVSFYDHVRLHSSCCAYKCFCLPQGRICKMEVDDKILCSKEVINHNLNKLHLGAYVVQGTDKTGRYTIVVKKRNIVELREFLTEIPKYVNIQIDSDYEGAIWK